MNEEIIKQINNTKRYFISNKGYCFKVQGTREIKIPLNIINGIPRVKIQNQKLSLIFLMFEYFMDEKYVDSKYTYKVVDDKIPISNIKIKSAPKKASTDDRNMFLYKCNEKASSSNSRVKFKQTITGVDVLNSLKRNNFKCFYCGEKIKTKLWHLDHVTPLFLGGLNNYDNLTCACKECNLMKGALSLKAFIDKCYKIVNNNNKY